MAFTLPKIVGHALIVLLLTILSQIGGLSYAASLYIVHRWFASASRPLSLFYLVFAAVYGLTWTAAYTIAPSFGRIPLPCFEQESQPLVSAAPIFCVLNRHYVTPELRGLLVDLAVHVDKQFPGTLTQTLDAGFPFLEGFPMLPHLSHNDGEKVDLAFYYEDQSRAYSRGGLGSPIGYWAFENPSEVEQQPCLGRRQFPTLRWDMTWFQLFVDYNLVMEDQRNKSAIMWLADEGGKRGLGKILLEPHLKERLGLSTDIIRFQGCLAARHDDHLHLQLQ